MTDEELFRQAKKDVKAMTALYDRYAERIYKYVSFRVPKKEDAEDIVSLTFEKVLLQRSSLRFTQSFSAWIHTVAKRKIIDYWRTHRTTFSLEDTDVSTQDNLDHTLDNKHRLENLLGGLTPEERAMLILHVLDGLTYKEIARMYGLSTDAVKKRFERLKKKCQTYETE